jgi:hypothetical protein
MWKAHWARASKAEPEKKVSYHEIHEPFEMSKKGTDCEIAVNIP